MTRFREFSDIKVKMMKYILKTTLALLVVSCALSLLASCTKGNKFDMNDDGNFVDKKTNIVYTAAPACYEPIAMGEEVYGTLKGENADVLMYEIVGAASDKMLCESTGTVFYAEGFTLPTLNKMNISACEIEIGIDSFRDVFSEDTETLIRTYTEGESFERPMASASLIVQSVRVRFEDSDLGLYYYLSYMELSEDYVFDGVNYGKYFLFNRFENRCVSADGLLDGYFG